ncbi:MAG: hypothetical protein JWO41_927 [Candidatus Saccharibacteria bacterium]|nr:hypothetical protein [Candidatus Saccharibacteria bacterium]
MDQDQQQPQNQQEYNDSPTPEQPSPPVVVSSEPSWQPEPAASTALVAATTAAPTSLVPQPVVNVLSPRGVEYVFLVITLFTAAIGLSSGLLAAVNGALSFSSLSFPTALLLVSLPLFAWLFLRLKKAELLDPGAALDASKRRSTQTTQIICFLVVLFTLIGLVTAVMAKIGGNLGESIVKIILDVLVLLVVFGGILAYYWRDEHKA